MRVTTYRRISTMRHIKILVLGGLITGALMTSSGCAVADRWYHDGGDYSRLEAARARLAYDLRHDASASRIARDRAEIQAILDELERDRRYSWNTNRRWDRDRWDRYDRD